MRTITLSGVAIAVGISVMATLSYADSAAKPATFKEKLSYSIGAQIGGNLLRDQLDLDVDIVMRGIKDAYGQKQSALTNDEMRDTLVTFQQQRESEKANWRNTEGEKNRREGKAFLAKNKTAPDVKSTKSGLQYKVVSEGKGVHPKPGDQVKVHYRGTLLSGEEFDSSYRAGEPAVFGLSDVIPGWTEGLQLMSLGSKYRFFIPAELAYGSRGAGNIIGPDAVLIFDVELLDIKTGR